MLGQYNRVLSLGAATMSWSAAAKVSCDGSAEAEFHSPPTQQCTLYAQRHGVGLTK